MSRKQVSIQGSIKARGGGNTNHVSLFPFLAVLLCTMGALIMLLVLIARNVHEQVDEPPLPASTAHDSSEEAEPKMTAEEASQVLEKIRLETEEAEWFAENLAKSKTSAMEKLAETRAWLASFEKETQKVRDEIERLAKLSEQLDQKEPASDVDLARLKQMLDSRKQQQRDAQTLLEQLQKEAEKNAKSYAIIPYRGQSGTFRRPIYIECRDDKVIIQPEGIELTAADFAAADRPDNPLDAAMRVVRQYYTETGQIERGTEPYPLLVVRPSGVEAYSAARSAMGSWVNEYGYELVDEDWKMEYPPASAELAERIRKQLDVSRNRMLGYLAAQRANRSTYGTGPQYRVDHNGVVKPLEDPEIAVGMRQRGSGRARSGGGTVPGNGNGIENENLMGDGVYRPNTPIPQANEAPGGAASAAARRAGTGDSDLSLVERRRNGTGGGTAGGAVGGTIGDEALYGMTMPESLAGDQARSAAQGSQNQGAQPALFGVPYGNDFSTPATTPMTDGWVGQNGSVTNAQGTRNAAGETSKQAVGPTEGTQAAAAAPLGSHVSAGLTPDASGMPVGVMTMSTNPQQGLPPEPGQQGYPQAQAKTRPNKKPPENKPENWALRDVRPFSAAVKRNVKIQCEAEKFVLVPQTGLMGVRVVPIGESVYDSSDQLVRHIWEFMDSWGIAGEKYFWQPVLQVKVMPGGERRFEELRWILRNSGLLIEQVN